jgi:DNA-3-methyladenine glycosylase I
MSSLDHEDGRARCPWCGNDPVYVAYHDTEWGVPDDADQALFEKYVLDSFQAGLSWLTVLKKREAMRERFEGFVPERLARWGDGQIQAALLDARIIRSEKKIKATVKNARCLSELREREGFSFSDFVWGFVGHKPVQNAFANMDEVPTQTQTSRDLSKALKSRGFVFCGPVMIYAFMQAVGMVNDHLTGCFRHAEVRSLAETP